MYNYVLIFFIFATACFAQTEVEGEVSGVWTQEGSPYLVLGNIIVPQDQILTIEPGVTVSFESEYDSIKVFGSFQALGSERDSIIFQSNDFWFRGIFQFSTDTLRLSYCDFSRCNNWRLYIRVEQAPLVVSDCWVRNCRINSGPDDWFLEITDSEVMSIDNYTTGVLRLFGNNLLGTIDFGRNSIMSGNTGEPRIRLASGENSVIENNHFTGGSLYSSRTPSHFRMEQNHLEMSVMLGSSSGVGNNVLVTNNEIYGKLSISSCSETVISGNRIYSRGWSSNNAIAISGNANLTIERNLLSSITTDGRGDIIIRNNTFVPWGHTDYALHHDSDAVLDFYNNIIYGDGDCAIVKSRREREASIHHNLYWEVSELFINVEPGERNIEGKPQFVGGRDYDYNLQVISPAIDAGDPDSPEDPDGTRADIGCHFFDQRIDHNPVIVSRIRDYAKQGGNFTYIARGTDDGDELTYGFANLPDWFRVIDRNNEESLVTLSGAVPEMQDDFLFGITIIDDNNQITEETINVVTSPWTVLRDTLPEIVESVDSPFRVVSDIVIPANQFTTIEPGCVFNFNKYEEHTEIIDPLQLIPQDARFGLFIDGGINAAGTEAEPIVFRYEGNNPGLLDYNKFVWQGVIINAGEDSIVFSHCVFQDGYYNLKINNRNRIRITNCDLRPCSKYRLYVLDSQDIVFSENKIRDFAYRSIGKIYFWHCQDLTIERNVTGRNIGGFLLSSCRNIQINGNNKTTGIELNFGCENVLISNNRLSIVQIINGGRNITVENNTINRGEGRAYSGFSLRGNNQVDEIVVRNNIITNHLSRGILLPDEDVNLLFENNNVWGHPEEDYPAENIFDIGMFVDVNANGDSIDVYGNFSADPRFIGFGPYKYNIQPDSPCIDVGHPDFPEDPDGSISDVGWYSFNHDNILPEVIGFHPQQTEINLSGDSTLVFTIDVHDPDDDSLTYLWTLDHIWQDQSGMEYSKKQLISDDDNIEHHFDFDGQYQLTCEYSEGNGYGSVTWDIGYVLSAGDENDQFPDEFTLQNAYPNPFNSSTSIFYTIPHPGNLSLNLYDLQGRNISREIISVPQAGRFSKVFDLSGYPTGMYLVEVGFESIVQRQKMVLIR